MGQHQLRMKFTVIFLIFMTVTCVDGAAHATMRTRRQLSEFVMDYEEVHLDEEAMLASHHVIRRNSGRGKLQWSFAAFGEQFDIVLRRHDKFLAPNASVIVVNDEGATIITDFSEMMVHYRGETGHAAVNEVRASLLQSGLHLMIYVNGKMWSVEPSRRHAATAKRTLTMSHVIFPLGAVRKIPESMDTNSTHPLSFCGTEHHAEDHAEHHAEDHAEDQSNDYAGEHHADTHNPLRLNTWQSPEHYKAYQSLHRRLGANGNALKNTCEMALVSDHRFYADFNSVPATQNEMVKILEDASLIYKYTTFTSNIGIGIQLLTRQLLVYQTAGASGNPYVTAQTSSSEFLKQLKGNVMASASVCLKHAFTAQTFDSGVLGLAYVGTTNAGSAGICNVGTNTLNIGISTRRSFGSVTPYATLMLVFAHEVGHNFGAAHDNDCLTFCNSDPSKCVSDKQVKNLFSGGDYLMWPVSVNGNEGNNNEFSPCSIFTVSPVINARGDVCFTNTANAGSICGNGIVEESEPCDCGSTLDQAACDTVDSCCTTNCTLKAGKQCSPKVGECCDSSCKMIGDNNFTGTSTPCGTPTNDCRSQRYCVKDPSFFGRCPSEDYVNATYNYKDNFLPIGCFDMGVAAPSCTLCFSSKESTACLTHDDKIKYKYHKPSGTACNSGNNVCDSVGCSGSICSSFNSTDNAVGNVSAKSYNITSFVVVQCEVSASPCLLACQFSADNASCSTIQSYKTTPHGALLGITINGYQPLSTSCSNGLGLCDAGGACQVQVEGSPLDALLNFNLGAYFIEYWYVSLGIAVFFALLPWCLRFDLRKVAAKIAVKDNGILKRMSVFALKNRANITPGTKNEKKSLGNFPINSKTIPLVLENRRVINDGPPKNAIHRVQTLFPDCPNEIVQRLITLSPHEEAVVSRLLRLKWPMKLLSDQSLLSEAGKRANKDKTRENRRSMAPLSGLGTTFVAASKAGAISASPVVESKVQVSDVKKPRIKPRESKTRFEAAL